MSPAPARRTFVWLAKIMVSAVLLGLLVSRVDAALLWASARRASPAWLAAALGLYLVMVAISAWRWGVLLDAVQVHVRASTLFVSFLVAVFFNNFLPSNIGGDVIRIADTSRPAGSKTAATLVVLFDRGVGLAALIFFAAMGASIADGLPGTDLVGPALLWLAFLSTAGVAFALIAHRTLFVVLLKPIQRLHPEWVGERLLRLDGLLGRLRLAPGALMVCLAAAIASHMLMAAFYLTVARSLSIPVSYWQLAVIVPMTFLVQMLPMSINGFGVREASFAYYFTRISLSIEDALLVSFMGAAVMLLFSVSGAAAYVARNRSTGRNRAEGRQTAGG